MKLNLPTMRMEEGPIFLRSATQKRGALFGANGLSLTRLDARREARLIASKSLLRTGE